MSRRTPTALTKAARTRWTVYGALFGVAFPLMAAGIRVQQLGAESALAAFASDPLLWIIATAPLFLGGFAYLGGEQHDRVQKLTLELEQRVKERTAELEDLLIRVQLVLDSIGDALIMVTYEGELAQAPSLAARAWFSEQGDQDVASWIFGEDVYARDIFRAGLIQLADDVLPYELLLYQLPRSFRRNGRVYELEYRRIEAGSTPRGLLLVIRDVTLALAAAAAERERREQQEIVAGMLRDPGGFQRSREEMDRLVAAACNSQDARTRSRSLHTIKGNAAVMGFTTFSGQLHQLETQLSGGDVWNDRHVSQLQAGWKQALELISHFGGAFRSDRIELNASEIDVLLNQVRARASVEVIENILRRWKLSPTRPMLTRLAEHAQRMARSLHRNVRVAVDDNETRVDSARTHEFWQGLVHVVRNAIDHGLDSAEEREALGKPEVPTLRMSSEQADGQVLLRISDDGRGIDWEAIRNKAKSAGLPHTTQQELTEALFADGISSREDVTELSGRGVGLSALRAACERLDISIALDTQRGRGTTFTFCLPDAAIGAEPLERRTA